MASINRSTFSNFAVAERSAAVYSSQALLRWSLVIVFLWFGGMKFTSYRGPRHRPFHRS
jgi:reactive chlorine resistance protein C